jgi:hypothetical protein
MVRPDDDTLATVNAAFPCRRDTPDRRLIGDAVGERDEAFLMELQSAGYTAETIVLAELTPQIQIAWADGEVSQREREVIVESAAHRRIPPQSRVSVQLARWLERRPSEDLFRISRVAITRMLRRLPAQLQSNVRRSLLREFGDVAAASGGFLGWRSVATDEQAVIDSIASAMDPVDPPTAPGTDSKPSASGVSAGKRIRG